MEYRYSIMTEEVTKQLENLSLTNNKKKEKPVLYWAVSLNLDSVMKHPDISSFLDSHKDLVPLEKIHSTLLFVGRRKEQDDQDQMYTKLVDKPCQLKVRGYGHSDKALALDVESITFLDDDEQKPVPSSAVKQHVTVALSKDTKAVDSVKTLLGEGTVVEFKEPLMLTGTVKGFKW